MFKLKKTLTALCLLLSQLGFSQHTLSGKFTDESGHPFPYLEVTVTQGDSTLAGSLTGATGAFQLNLPSGNYLLKATLFGEVRYEKTLALRHSLDLGTLSVKKGLKLNEVAITGQKKILEQKLDRLVFHLENAVMASGGDVLDALRVTPGVQIRSGQLRLIGRGALRVMVDGRILPLQGEELTDFLQSLSADDIQRIEVITNPPARYEAEGDSGLINLVYKKGRRDPWNAQIRGAYTQNIYAYYRASGRFSYHEKALALSLSLNGRAGDVKDFDTARTYYPRAQTWEEATTKKTMLKDIAGRLNLSYSPTQKMRFGLLYSGSLSKPGTRTYDGMRVYKPAGGLDLLITTRDTTRRPSSSQALNLHYRFKPDSTGKSLSLDLDYFTYDHDIYAHFESQSQRPDEQTGTVRSKGDNQNYQKIKNYSAKVDVEYPTKAVALAYGAKVSFTRSDNASTFFDLRSGEAILNPDKSAQFQYRENTQALYLSASKKLDPHWQSKLGIRVENTQTRGRSGSRDPAHKDHYTELFPSFYLAYTPSAAHVFSFSYGKRINRPTYHMLDPYRWYFSGDSYVTGNPLLQPAFTENFKLSHSWKEKLTTSLLFYKTRQGFEQVPHFNAETGQQIYTRENFYSEYRYSLETYFHFKPRSWWQNQEEFHLNYVRYDFDPTKVTTRKNEGSLFYLSTHNRLLFNPAHSLEGEVDFWYASHERFPLGTEDPKYSLDLGVSALLLDKKLQVSLTARDILKTSRSYGTLYIGKVKQVMQYSYPAQRVILSLRYQIGNEKVKVQKRAFGNEQEQERS